MKVFNTIIGLLAIYCALYCIFWPDDAFLNAGWFVALITFLWGICAVATYLIDRQYHEKDDNNLASGALGLIFGIAACALSILSAFNPTLETIFLVLVLILLMTFLALTGLKNIIIAIRTKHSKTPQRWWVWLIIGLVQLLLICVGLLHWLFGSTDDGLTEILIGTILGVFGLTLIATVFSHDKLNRWEKL